MGSPTTLPCSSYPTPWTKTADPSTNPHTVFPPYADARRDLDDRGGDGSTVSGVQLRPGYIECGIAEHERPLGAPVDVTSTGGGSPLPVPTPIALPPKKFPTGAETPISEPCSDRGRRPGHRTPLKTAESSTSRGEPCPWSAANVDIHASSVGGKIMLVERNLQGVTIAVSGVAPERRERPVVHARRRDPTHRQVDRLIALRGGVRRYGPSSTGHGLVGGGIGESPAAWMPTVSRTPSSGWDRRRTCIAASCEDPDRSCSAGAPVRRRWGPAARVPSI